MIQEIIFRSGISPNLVVKKKFGKSPEITFKQLIEAIIQYRSGKEVCAHFHFSEKTYKNLMKKLFPDVVLSGGRRDWRYYLVSLTDYKWCGSCESFVLRDRFPKKSNSIDGIGSQCKPCYGKYYQENRQTIIASANKRRAAELQAIPRWADEIAINMIYADCPAGFEVDHIIPLQGENVCGLHCESNLQYLRKAENRAKGNKHD